MQRARTPEARAHKKELILDSARALFIKHGYNSTTIEAIMQKAGLSTGTYYLYFKTKTDVFKELLSQGIDILDGLFTEAISWSGSSTRETLTGIVKAYLDFYNQNNEYFEILAVMSAQSEDLRERQSKISKIIVEKNHNILKRIEEIIIAGQKSGELTKNQDSWLLAFSLWGLMDGILLLAKRGNLKTANIELDQLVRTALDAFFIGVS